MAGQAWPVRRGPTSHTKTLNWACGLSATLLGVLAAPLSWLIGFVAWGFWSDGALAASIYFSIVALAILAVPVAFLLFYDRWQSRNGLQSR